MTETFTKKDNSKKSVVLIEYPKRVHGQSVLLLRKTKLKCRVKQKKIVNVFIPTTPNPTSGFLIMFPKRILFI